MKKYLLRIEKIKEKLVALEKENFEPAASGTHHKVFLSNRYVIRFRDDDSKLLLREADFLKKLDHPLIPQVLWTGEARGHDAMVEHRLRGKSLDHAWRTLPKAIQQRIIHQIVEFIQYLKTQTVDDVYSVRTGKNDESFFDFLTDDLQPKIFKIKKHHQTSSILKDLIAIIVKPESKNLFVSTARASLVHGDLINHNLLTNGQELTGVLDWELALWGDPDYDLSRLFYYQECAKAYEDQGRDETYEADYMDKFITAILNSNLIENKKVFERKHQVMRAIFYLNALAWAVSFESPEENIDELITLWNKKSGAGI